MTTEQIKTVKEVVDDLDKVIRFPIDGADKTVAQIAFFNGSFVSDFNKNKIIIEELLRTNNDE